MNQPTQGEADPAQGSGAVAEHRWTQAQQPATTPEPGGGRGTGAGEARAEERGPRDPLAVAIGNASLLGVGYLLLGRRWLASAAVVITAGLVVVLTTTAPRVWVELVVVLWWLVTTGHGWLLAGGRRGGAVRRGQRVTALAVTVPVVVAVGLLRFDAARIEGEVGDALGAGDCGPALAALDGVWFGHRVADAPMTVRGERTVEACGHAGEAAAEFAEALGGDASAVRAGFAQLSTVLSTLPGHERVVEVVLDGFLDALPTRDACGTSAITDVLGERAADGTVLDRGREAVAAVAPAALVSCGNDLMAANDWTNARTRYRQLLDRYPGHALAAEATAGVRAATLAIELAQVRGLLGPASTGSLPRYCSAPAAYSGAGPFGTGRVLVYGNEYASRLPGEWRTAEAAEATAVVCAGDSEMGAARKTCTYRPVSGAPIHDVTFHDVVVPVKVYELRTGKLVVDTKVSVAGATCPQTLSYTIHGSVDTGGPPDVYVTPTDEDVRAAFQPVLTG
ncbi:hypothetical protein L6E12_32130 [Actinokineospora sp. PR83]|uniref:tetratricopeptide repeat protein n=1 Tax=Actinokineospora sp. PR83 TaxID=2884908 RepID=UPI001F490419|nr:hypothetical protein [Actinokineospora sp. PR83]MCG8920426.1 hypothetical protein [Actinokineospora sp. PR83]